MPKIANTFVAIVALVHIILLVVEMLDSIAHSDCSWCDRAIPSLDIEISSQ